MAQRGAKIVHEVIANSEGGVDEHTEAFAAFAAKHFHFEERDDAGRIDFGRVETDDRESVQRKIRQLLREGYDFWTGMNRDKHGAQSRRR